MRFGDRVVVESPGFPPFLDLLDVLGAEAVPVRLDEQGMRPEALAGRCCAGPSRCCCSRARRTRPVRR